MKGVVLSRPFERSLVPVLESVWTDVDVQEHRVLALGLSHQLFQFVENKGLRDATCMLGGEVRG